MDHVEERERVGPSPASSPRPRSTAGSSQPFDGGQNSNYIIHTVSKYDTLAGVAIKYGVEVADIKRLNGLATDLQMFALKSLKIPLRGRHPPSSILCNGRDSERPSSSEQSMSSLRHFDLFDSVQSLKFKSSPYQHISPVMSNLQGHHGLRHADQRVVGDGFEMSVYNKGGGHNLDDEHLLNLSSSSTTSLTNHTKSRSITNGFTSNNNSLLDPLLSQGAENNSGSDKWLKRLMRRRQKSEDDLTSSTSEKLLKDEDKSNGSISSVASGKGLAPKPKAESSLNPIPIGLGDAFVIDTCNGVRKASSTSSLQDWNLKPDFQALTASGMARSIFDGLPKPIGRRNKKALD